MGRELICLLATGLYVQIMCFVGQDVAGRKNNQIWAQSKHQEGTSGLWGPDASNLISAYLTAWCNPTDALAIQRYRLLVQRQGRMQSCLQTLPAEVHLAEPPLSEGGQSTLITECSDPSSPAPSPWAVTPPPSITGRYNGASEMLNLQPKQFYTAVEHCMVEKMYKNNYSIAVKSKSS